MVVERINMGQLKLEKENDIIVTKTHAEILEIIEEIKDFENKFSDFDTEFITSDEDLIDVDLDIFDDEIIRFVEVDKFKLEEFGLDRSEPFMNKKRSKKRIRIRYGKNKEIDKIKTIHPTIFRLRFNREGKLINPDLIKKKPEIKSKKSSILNKIKIKKGKKQKEETTEDKSKFSKFKSGFGKLKKAIPDIRRKKEEPEEE